MATKETIYQSQYGVDINATMYRSLDGKTHTVKKARYDKMWNNIEQNIRSDLPQVKTMNEKRI